MGQKSSETKRGSGGTERVNIFYSISDLLSFCVLCQKYIVYVCLHRIPENTVDLHKQDLLEVYVKLGLKVKI